MRRFSTEWKSRIRLSNQGLKCPSLGLRLEGGHLLKPAQLAIDKGAKRSIVQGSSGLARPTALCPTLHATFKS